MNESNEPGTVGKDTIFIANIGLSDLKYGSEPVAPAREKGKEILDKLNGGEIEPDELEMPLLAPCFDFFREQGKRINLMLLSYTDQDEDVGEELRENDTIYTAEVIERIVSSKYQDLVGEVRRKKIDAQPHLYDECLEFFRGVFIEITEEQPVGTTEIYVNPTGGTPAASTGLLLGSIAVYGTDARQIYLPRGGSEPVELGFGAEVLREYSRQKIKELAKKAQFKAALDLLYHETETADSALENALLSAAYRLQFEIGLACELLEDMGEGPMAQKVLSGLRKAKEALEGNDFIARDKAKLVELYWQMLVKLNNGEAGDFLYRWELFSETAVVLALKKFCSTLGGLNVDPLAFDTVSLDKFVQFNNTSPTEINKCTTFSDFVDESNREGNWITIPGPVDISSSRQMRNVALIEYSAGEGAFLLDDENKKKVRKFVEEWGNLNRSLVGVLQFSYLRSGFEDTVVDAVAGALECESPERMTSAVRDRMTKIMAVLGVEPGDDPYRGYARYISYRLDQR